ncbi:hypothetical protein J6590_088977 [Homalodisca vitripennis]|nr:hypothetical protein J6590_088977 [Homalodisca vitripennis]
MRFSPSFYFGVWYLTLSQTFLELGVMFVRRDPKKVGDEEAQNVPLHRLAIRDTYTVVVSLSHHQVHN